MENKKEEKIPLLSELLELDPATINNESVYVMYPTEVHREQDSRGWIPGTELKLWQVLEKENRKKKELASLWGNFGKR